MSKTSYDGPAPDSMTVLLHGLFSRLTTKLAQAFVDALDHGYCSVPRGMTADGIARKRVVPRTSYDLHLRKAENKITAAISPYVRLYFMTQPSNRPSLENDPRGLKL